MKKEFDEYIKMKMHEVMYVHVGGYSVIRVPGGIIYRRSVKEMDRVVGGVDTYIRFPDSLSEKLSKL